MVNMEFFEKEQNRYRNFEIWWLNFPDGITPNDVEIFGYNAGERLNSKQPVNFQLFDSVSFYSFTFNDHDKEKKHPMIIALARSSKGGEPKVLTLKFKTK